ncbi:PadR family transcriptional regulator [Shewanella sp. SP2S2-6]|uniref:PadR family transcriptional regulator n=1 Tax=Shewanella sp. SP2S2-6 TaxID=3063540 RepID=UPI002890CF44|nr:PadR family transcriptional regulator [Shewanella sp. SP2S2-6]MDT3297439.1 PadR family transcriptional regulator [Shewanella sp. SP2S2-6]
MTSSQLVKMRLELRRGVLVLAVLGLLKQAHYGYSLRKQLQEGGIDIDEGTLYPLVRRLADQGLLDSEWRQAEGRERRYYQLSSLGAELLSQLTDEWQQLNGALAFLLEQSADTNSSDINRSDESAEEI